MTNVINIEPRLVADAELIFGKWGLSVSEAVTMFFRKTVLTGEISADVVNELERKETLRQLREVAEEIRADAKRNGTSEMTLEEINFEITESRRERRERGEL